MPYSSSFERKGGYGDEIQISRGRFGVQEGILVQEQPQDLCRCGYQAKRCGCPQQQRRDEKHGVLYQ